MKHHYFLVPLLMVVALTACPSRKPYQQIEMVPGEQFEVGSLHVEFVRVVEDSRCPSDSTCVWAGEVKVQLSTRLGRAEAVSHEIVAGQQTSIGEFLVTVVQVLPEKTSTHEIAPGEYRITLKTERAAD